MPPPPSRPPSELRFTHLFVLVGGDADEDGLWEGEGDEAVPPEAEDVVGLHDVETRLVLVHRVQDDLENDNGKIKPKLIIFIVAKNK